MKPLNALIRDSVELPFKLGEELGSGVDGQVFEVIESYTEHGYPVKRNSVIKLSALYGHDTYQRYLRRAAHLDFLKRNRTPHFAAVFQFGTLGSFTVREELFSSSPFLMDSCVGCLIYYTEMEKLYPLSSDEKKLFHTLLSHEDANRQKDFSPEALSKRIEELAGWFSFERHDALNFCLAATSGSIRHKDLHERNIMKDAWGEFKLIDMDRLELVSN